MKSNSVPTSLVRLWHGGFFKSEKVRQQIVEALSKDGCHPTASSLRMALKRAKYLRQYREQYAQRYPPKVVVVQDVIPDDVLPVLQKICPSELRDLKHNAGVSGDCTAFLLRKILEKLIFHVFARDKQLDTLKNAKGHLLGLGAMIGMASSHPVGTKPYLMPKTAEELNGVKFLGDTGVHNPMINVPLKTVNLALPYITVAYQELAKRL
jgi:hypothetical protein